MQVEEKNAKIDLANIVTNEAKELKGFKVLGVFPFYLTYIKTGVHIKLCKLRVQIEKLCGNQPATLADYYNPELMSNIQPLINKYILMALINDRFLGFLFYLPMRRKIKQCSHRQIWNLYATIYQLDEPAFFLDYWRHLRRDENTLLKEEKQSSGNSSHIKSEQE